MMLFKKWVCYQLENGKINMKLHEVSSPSLGPCSQSSTRSTGAAQTLTYRFGQTEMEQPEASSWLRGQDTQEGFPWATGFGSFVFSLFLSYIIHLRRYGNTEPVSVGYSGRHQQLAWPLTTQRSAGQSCQGTLGQGRVCAGVLAAGRALRQGDLE